MQTVFVRLIDVPVGKRRRAAERLTQDFLGKLPRPYGPDEFARALDEADELRAAAENPDPDAGCWTSEEKAARVLRS